MAFGLALAAGLAGPALAQPLAVFEHHVVGARLRTSPEELFVPKDIPGSLLVQFTSADGGPHADAERLGRDHHVEAVLRGPAFPAYRLLGFPGEPLVLPPLALVGDYQIDDIRLVHTPTGETRALAAPHSLAVHVFPDVLVSQVVSRPLTIDEIAARGIVVDATSFSVLEFEATFTLGGRAFPVTLPVVTPRFTQAQELFSLSEREALTVEAARLNRRLADTVTFPPELRLPGLDVAVQGVNFEEVSTAEEEPTGRRAAGLIPALVVIPGGVGFLHQFFSVQIFTANAAPTRSTLTVHSIEAELLLPPGRDRVLDTDDDPIRLARVGSDAVTAPIVPVRGVGPDGRAGTADDAVRLQPGQSAQGEFVLEGLREGLHTFDLRLRGTLDGYAQREVHIEGVAAGSVLVRNPRFSIAMSHPRAVRAGEPYTAAITVLNTSDTPAYLVTASLSRASIGGAELAPGQLELVTLGTLAPGEARTAEFDLIARTTGEVRMAELTSDDGLSGRFDLTAAVDERGVSLSTHVIGYPEWVALLPPEVRSAADRVLGRALAAATAAQLPPGVRRVELDDVRQRVIELAEAGQRIGHGDRPERVYLDLLLDWHGGRTDSRGFDQILRETTAGGELRQALMDAIALETDDAGLTWIAARAPDIAGRGEAWGLATTDAPDVPIAVLADAGETSESAQGLPGSGLYRSPSGPAVVLVRDPGARRGLEVVFRAPAGSGAQPVEWVTTSSSGTGVRARWSVAGSADADVCYRYLPATAPDTVTVDVGCARASTGALPVVRTPFAELPPELLAADQDLSVHAERPIGPCFGPSFPYFGATRTYENYGTVALLLFSKPMSRDSLMRAGAIQLDSGVQITGAAVQPGGRVVLANFRQGFGLLRPRGVELAPFVTDERGTPPLVRTRPLDRTASEGVAIEGRVVGLDGAPAVGVPVTLTMHDTTVQCYGVDVRSAQVISDDEGRFSFDFVMADVPYSLSATDIRGLSDTAAALLREAAPTGELDADELARLVAADGRPEVWQGAENFGDAEGTVLVAQSVDRAVLRDHVSSSGARVGSTVPVTLRFRGRGRVSGIVLAGDGVTPVVGAAVNLFPDASSRELGRGMYSGAGGAFDFAGVPLGELSVNVTTADGASRVVAGRLDEAGQHLQLSVVLSTAEVPLATVEGTVYESDGSTPHPLARIAVTNTERLVVARGTADGLGYFELPNVTTDGWQVLAFSADGRRVASRVVTLTPGGRTAARLVLPGVGVVQGRVELANGQPAAGAHVAGGEAIAVTDATGGFTLTGVPSGRGRAIAAGLPSAASPDGYVRLGSADVDVLPGLTQYVVVRLDSAGRIRGRVFDASAQPIPYVRVAIPRPRGFIWADADANGNYAIAPLPLDSYVVSAPAPPLAGDATAALTDAALTAAGEQSWDQLQATLTELIPRLTTVRAGTPARAPPDGFGATSTALTADGQTVTADLHYLPSGAIAGRVLNHLGVPVAADVTLSALSLDGFGNPRVVPASTVRTDALTGEFEVDGVEVGPFTVVARSAYYPQQASVSGLTTLAARDARGLVLQFGAPTTHGARLSGRVIRDGLPVGAGVQVQVGDPSYVLTTSADGTFDSQVDLAARTYALEAFDPTTGRRGYLLVVLGDGQPAHVEVRLLAIDGGLDISVVDGLGAPVSGADVTIARVGMPATAALTQPTSAAGLAAWSHLTEGHYTASVCRLTGQARLCGSGRAVVPSAGRAALALQLAASADVGGVVVASDGVTPVPDAQLVATILGPVGDVALAVTDAQGAFDLIGLPLGTLQLTARNPTTGRMARTTAQLTTAGQRLQVRLREDPLGELVGGVVAASGSGYVPGAIVTLEPSNALFPPRAVTTDPAGQFTFPGVPPGSLQLTAQVPTTGFSGGVTATMPSSPVQLRVDIPLTRRGTLEVRTVGPDGAPQPARVTVISTIAGDTDAQGLATFSSLLLGTYLVEATSLVPGQTHSTASGWATLSLARDFVHVDLALSGVGAIDGQVLTAGGAPVPAAEVTLEQAAWADRTALTGADGRFTFADVAPGAARVHARLGAQAGAADAVITAGATTALAVALQPSGDVRGRLVRADGVTLVPDTEIVLSYAAPAGLSGTVRARTSSTAQFAFRAVPQGSITLRAVVPRYDGAVARLAVLDAPTLELGDVALDELAPLLVESLPEDGAAQVSVSAGLQLTFSEAMDPAFDDDDAVYVVDSAGVRAPCALTWATVGGEMRRLLVTPLAPLTSDTAYTLVVLGARQPALGGGFVGPGPVDLAERPMAAAQLIRFTTVDSVAPLVQAFTPEHLAEEVDSSAVVRLTFSEPMARATLALELVDLTTGLAVSAPLSTGLDDRLVVATPASFLEANRVYEARLVSASDRAGNPVAGLPRVHRFATRDTIGPTITDLAVAGAGAIVAGATIGFVATVSPAEPGVQIQATQNLVDFVLSDPGSGAFLLTVGGAGSVVHVRARGIDRVPNYGPWYEETFVVAANTPPSVTLAQTVPSSGPLLTGQPYSVRLLATDDSFVVRAAASLEGALTQQDQAQGATEVVLTGVVPSTLGAGSTATLRGLAEDNSGAVTTATPLVLDIADGTAPTPSMVAPNRQLQPGETFTVRVVADDAFGVTETTLVASGGMTFSGGATHVDAPLHVDDAFILTLPVAASAGTAVTLLATARDASGRSASVTQHLAVADIVPPTAEIVPAPGAIGVDVRAPVVVTFSEPVVGASASSIVLTAGGQGVPASVSVSSDRRVATLVPAQALSALTQYVVSVGGGIADDTAHALVPISSAFTTGNQDVVGPRLLAIRPAHSSTGAAIPLVVELEFDEPVLPSSLATLTLAPTGAGPSFVGLRAANAPPHIARFSFTTSPAPTLDTEYTAALGGRPTDAAGNAARDGSGAAWTPVSTTFRTGRARVAVAVNGHDGGARVVEGSEATAHVEADAQVQLRSFEWRQDGLLRPGFGASTTLAPPMLGSGGPTTLSVTARAQDTQGGTHDLAPLTVTVEARGGDADGDGLTNGEEASGGTDPWTDDAADDPDADGLTNAAELALGTNPNQADSDGDGALDGVDLAPLGGNRAPAIGVSAPDTFRGAMEFSGTSRSFVLPADLGLTTAATVEAWVLSFYEMDMGIFGSTTTPRALNIAQQADGRFSITVRVQGTSPVLHIGPTPFAASAWHHVAATFDGQRVRLYVDGRREVDAPLVGVLDHSSGPLAVDPTYLGLFDEVRVWSVARTAIELGNDMHRSLEGLRAGLAASYTFDGEGSALDRDASGHERHATATGVYGATPADAYPGEVVITQAGASQWVLFAAPDLDGYPGALVVSRLPAHGSLSVNSQVLTGPTVVADSSSLLTHTFEPGFFGRDTIEVYADDGTARSPPLTVHFDTPSPKTWLGAHPSNPRAWEEADNWSPAGAPTPADAVLIPAGAPPVHLTGSATVASIYVGAGASLTITDARETLRVTGDTVVDGEVGGLGRVRFEGYDSWLGGRFHALSIDGTATLARSTTVTGDLVLSARLRVGPLALVVGGQLTVTGPGSLEMRDPSALVDVGANLIWRSQTAQPSVLTSGTVRVHQRLAIEVGTFVASGDHRVELVGASVRLLMNPPSQLQHLDVRAAELIIEAPVPPSAPGLNAAGDVTIGAPDQPTHVHGDAPVLLAPVLNVGGNLSIGEGTIVDAASVAVGGDMQVSGLAQVNAPSVTARNISSAGASVTTDSLVIGSTVDATETVFAPSPGLSFTNLVIRGPVTLSTDLVVPGSLTMGTGGRLTLAGHSVTVGFAAPPQSPGGLTVVPYSSIRMTNAADVLDVAGDVVLHGAGSVWEAGELRVGQRLHVAERYALAATGTHRTRLVGPGATIDMVEPGLGIQNHLRHLEVMANALVTPIEGQVDGVWITGDLTIGDVASPAMLVTDGATAHVDGHVTIQSGSTWTSDSDISVHRIVRLGSGLLEAPRLILAAPTTQPVVSLAVDSGYLIQDLVIRQAIVLTAPLALPGNLSVEDPAGSAAGSFDTGGYATSIGGNLSVADSAAMRMVHPGQVTVAGDATFGSGGVLVSEWTDGVLSIGGTLRSLGNRGLYASGSHVTRMAGPQSRILMGGSNNRFMHLEVAGSTHVEPISGDAASGLRVAGDLTVGALGAPASLDTTANVCIVDGVATVAPGSSWSASTPVTARNLAALGNAQVSMPSLTLVGAPATSPVTFTPGTGLTLGALIVREPVTLAGSVFVAGDLRLTQLGAATGRLDLAGHAATVGGNLIVEQNTSVSMSSPTALLDVAGNATLDGLSTWTAGTLRIGGDLDVVSSGALSAAITHTTELAGLTTTVRMASPQSSAGANHLGRLRITSPSATVRARPSGSGDDVVVLGALELEGTSAAPAQLTVPLDRTLRALGAIDVGAYSTLSALGTVFGASCTRHSTAQVTGTLSCP